MYVSAIVLAAGKGSRFGSKISKPLARIKSREAIVYSFRALQKHARIRDIIVAVNAENRNAIEALIRRYKISKVRAVVYGGKERRDSVAHALEALHPQATIVLIHDSARPFIDRSVISAVIAATEKTGAAVVGVPVKATVKKIKSSCVVRRASCVKTKNLIVEQTIDRSNLWEIQTPQGFKAPLIREAFRKYGNANVTDDAMLVEKLGKHVSVVMGSYYNIKVTTPEDLVLAEAIASQWKQK